MCETTDKIQVKQATFSVTYQEKAGSIWREEGEEEEVEDIEWK